MQYNSLTRQKGNKMKLRIWDKTNKILIDTEGAEERRMVIDLEGRVRMVTVSGELWLRDDCIVLTEA